MKQLFFMLNICSFFLCCASASDVSAPTQSYDAVSALTQDSLSAKEELEKIANQKINTAMLEKNYPLAAEMHRYLGGVYFNEKEFESSEKHFKAFTRLYFEFLKPLCVSSAKEIAEQQRLAQAFAYMGHAQFEQKKYYEAISSYSSAHKSEPNDFFVSGRLALCYIKMNNFEMAKSVLTSGNP